MATIQIGDVTDLVNSTLPKIRKNVVNDYMTTLRSYVAASQLLDKGRRERFTGQYYPIYGITTGDTNARAAGLFEGVTLNQVDGTVVGQVPPRQIITGSTFDEQQLDANAGPEALFSFLKKLDYQMFKGWYDLIEESFWAGPSSSSDVKTPWGLLKYWLDYDATEGFNGGNHANFTGGPAGIDCGNAVYGARWQHYTGNYSTVDETLVDMMTNLYEKTEFKGLPEKPIKDGSAGAEHDAGIYTVFDTRKSLLKLMEGKDVGRRTDLVFNNGNPVFYKLPIVEVPWLTANRDTSRPIIFLDWNDFKVVYQGEWMQETPYMRAPNQPWVKEKFMKTGMQYAMENRRRHGLIAKASPISS